MKTVTIQTKAWMSSYMGVAEADLAKPESVNLMTFSTTDMHRHGCILVGDAEVSVQVPEGADLVEQKIVSLREMVAVTRADATAKCTEIEGQIQRLLCIENNPTRTDDDSPF